MSGAYPRANGGNSANRRSARSFPGLSPRGRGKPRLILGLTGHHGPIPARAGETDTTHLPTRRDRAYPRAGGGNASSRCCAVTFWGLSPRGRGKRHADYHARAFPGPIPARAGETLASIPLFLKTKAPIPAHGERLKFNWKRAISDAAWLLALHQQDAVCIHDFFRRLPQSFNAEITHRLCIPAN